MPDIFDSIAPSAAPSSSAPDPPTGDIFDHLSPAPPTPDAQAHRNAPTLGDAYSDESTTPSEQDHINVALAQSGMLLGDRGGGQALRLFKNDPGALRSQLGALRDNLDQSAQGSADYQQKLAQFRDQKRISDFAIKRAGVAEAAAQDFVRNEKQAGRTPSQQDVLQNVQQTLAQGGYQPAWASQLPPLTFKDDGSLASGNEADEHGILRGLSSIIPGAAAHLVTDAAGAGANAVLGTLRSLFEADQPENPDANVNVENSTPLALAQQASQGAVQNVNTNIDRAFPYSTAAQQGFTGPKGGTGAGLEGVVERTGRFGTQLLLMGGGVKSLEGLSGDALATAQRANTAFTTMLTGTAAAGGFEKSYESIYQSMKDQGATDTEAHNAAMGGGLLNGVVQGSLMKVGPFGEALARQPGFRAWAANVVTKGAEQGGFGAASDLAGQGVENLASGKQVDWKAAGTAALDQAIVGMVHASFAKAGADPGDKTNLEQRAVVTKDLGAKLQESGVPKESAEKLAGDVAAGKHPEILKEAAHGGATDTGSSGASDDGLNSGASDGRTPDAAGTDALVREAPGVAGGEAGGAGGAAGQLRAAGASAAGGESGGASGAAVGGEGGDVAGRGEPGAGAGGPGRGPAAGELAGSAERAGAKAETVGSELPGGADADADVSAGLQAGAEAGAGGGAGTGSGIDAEIADIQHAVEHATERYNNIKAAREAVGRTAPSMEENRLSAQIDDWKKEQDQLRAAPDRRQDAAKRKTVADMSPDELRKELLTNPVTGIPNRRAFDEGSSPAVGMSDANGLKALNDKVGYAAGDALLKAKAEVLKKVGLDAYHEKGDEFLYRGGSPAEIQGKLEAARKILREHEITYTAPDGTVRRFKGGDFEFGVGHDLGNAEAGLHEAKQRSYADTDVAKRGEFATGEQRGIRELPGRDVSGVHGAGERGQTEGRPDRSRAAGEGHGPDESAAPPAAAEVASAWTKDRINATLQAAYDETQGTLAHLHNLRASEQTGLHPDDLERYKGDPSATKALRPWVNEDAWGERPMTRADVDLILSQRNAKSREEGARDFARNHPDPTIRLMAWAAEHDGKPGARTEMVDVGNPEELLGKQWEYKGHKFHIEIDEHDVAHLKDDDISIPHAEQLGKVPADKGTMTDLTEKPFNEGLEKDQSRTLLGEPYTPPVTGSKTKSMFGDMSQGPASAIEADAARPRGAARDSETTEMFDKNGPGAAGVLPASMMPKASQRGVWGTLTDWGKQALGMLRGLRERFSPIEGRYGSDVAKAFIKVAGAPGAEARDLTSSFFRRAFGDVPDLETRNQYERDWTDLGRYLRLQDLRQRAVAAGTDPMEVGRGLPDLQPDAVKKLLADPVIQKGIKVYNKEVAPLLTDIRTRNGMLMNSNAGKMPFFLNLPGEFEGPRGTDTAVDPTKAFNRAAIGNDRLKMDPRDALGAAIRGHLATDYKQQLVGVLKKSYSAPMDQVAEDAKGFKAMLHGKLERVVPVDLAASDSKTPDLHYIPEPIAQQYEKIQQDRGDYNTLFDKAISAGTKASIIGDFAPHSARIIAHVGGRMGQAGMSPANLLPGWLGSNEAAIGRMTKMARSPLGDTMQLLIDRSGAEKGGGYNVKEGTTWIGKKLALSHDVLFNPESGVDPMARRVVADAHLRTVLGNNAMDAVEKALDAGNTTPAEASKLIERRLSDAQFVGLGRKVNGTLGFANAQTRSGLLNWAQRVMPFTSSQSGMIPREISKLANLDVPAMVAAGQRGEWKQLALQLGGSLATGGVGAYLAANALNWANTKAQTGTGRFMSDNDDGHKSDVWMAPGWHLSNLDPTYERAMRLAGIKGAGEGQPAGQSAARESLNELLSLQAKTTQIAFTAASALAGDTSAMHVVWDDKGKPSFMHTGALEGGVPLVSNTAKALSKGEPVGPAVLQDATSALTGTRLKPDASPESKATQEYYRRVDDAKAILRDPPSLERNEKLRRYAESIGGQDLNGAPLDPKKVIARAQDELQQEALPDLVKAARRGDQGEFNRVADTLAAQGMKPAAIGKALVDRYHFSPEKIEQHMKAWGDASSNR